jgi:hypothetical protein
VVSQLILEFTDWQPCAVKPSIVGLYQYVDADCDDVYWSYFDGAAFNGAWSSRESALDHREFSREHPDMAGVDLEHGRWRGLTQQCHFALLKESQP